MTTTLSFLRSTLGRVLLLAAACLILALAFHSAAPAALMPLGIGFLVNSSSYIGDDETMKSFIGLGVADDRGTFQSPVQTKKITLTEAGAAGVYTGSHIIPAGATILDIIVDGIALWGAGTSATLKVGDAGNDAGYYTGVNTKATDLLAGESLSFALAGGKAGAYIANSQVSPRYSATARVISAILTTVGTAASTGVTHITIIYSTPQTQDIVAATKV